MIGVVGSSGRVGGLVARGVESGGDPMRLLVRDPGRVPRVAGAQVAAGGYGAPASVVRGVERGDRVFMVSLWIGGDVRLDLPRSFIEAAARAEVPQLVYLSFVNAAPNAVCCHAREHGATEAMLKASGVPWTAIRNSMYADDIPGWFDPDGVAREPGDEARMSFSYRPELADVIAMTLTGPVHRNKIYNITTPESVSMRELAQIASRVTGEAYSYEQLSDAEWIERRKAQRRPQYALEAGQTSYEALRAGELDDASTDYEKVTGRRASSVAEIMTERADEIPRSTSAADCSFSR